MFIFHLRIFFGEGSLRVFGSVFNGDEVGEFFGCFGEQSFIHGVSGQYFF